jgi:hypothetical protein
MVLFSRVACSVLSCTDDGGYQPPKRVCKGNKRVMPPAPATSNSPRSNFKTLVLRLRDDTPRDYSASDCTIEKRARVDVGGNSAISSTQRNRMLQARTPRPCRLVMQGQLAVCVTPQKDDPGWGVGISGTTTIANVCDKTNPIWFFLSRPRGLKTLIRTQLRLVCPDVNETTAPQVETHQQGQWGIPKCHGLHWYAVHQLRRAQDRL